MDETLEAFAVQKGSLHGSLSGARRPRPKRVFSLPIMLAASLFYLSLEQGCAPYAVAGACANKAPPLFSWGAATMAESEL